MYYENLIAMSSFIRNIPPYIPTALIFIAICYLSLTSEPLPHQQRWFEFPGSDKVAHFIMYAALTASFCFDYYRRQGSIHKQWHLIAALAVAIVTGAALELMQAHMAMGRTGDIIDFAANTMGAIVGIVSGHKIFARLGTI